MLTIMWKLKQRYWIHNYFVNKTCTKCFTKKKMIPSLQNDSWYPGSQPCKHDPFMWWQESLFKQFPQTLEQFSPYDPGTHSNRKLCYFIICIICLHVTLTWHWYYWLVLYLICTNVQNIQDYIRLSKFHLYGDNSFHLDIVHRYHCSFVQRFHTHKLLYDVRKKRISVRNCFVYV